MGGREGNPDPALQSFVTGINTPTVEGGTVTSNPFLSPQFINLELYKKL